MGSVRTDRIMLGLLVAGLLAVTTACALVAEMRRALAAKPPSTVVQPPAPESVSASVPAAASAPATETRPALTVTPVTPAAAAASAASPLRVEPQEQPQALQAPATAAERQPKDADDPRAVIDWLLNRSSVRGR